jgi:hypothetical protein
MEKINFEVSTCNHDSGKYSLSIIVNNASVSLSNHCYDHRPGNHNDIAIFGLTKDDMLNLIKTIKKTVNKI